MTSDTKFSRAPFLLHARIVDSFRPRLQSYVRSQPRKLTQPLLYCMALYGTTEGQAEARCNSTSHVGVLHSACFRPLLPGAAPGSPTATLRPAPPSRAREKAHTA